jgi:hypothetical protein
LTILDDLGLILIGKTRTQQVRVYMGMGMGTAEYTCGLPTHITTWHHRPAAIRVQHMNMMVISYLMIIIDNSTTTTTFPPNKQEGLILHLCALTTTIAYHH